MSRTALLSATAVAAALLACGPAQAAPVMRAWVSGHGTDAAGCGAPTAPCRSLQYVHDQVIAPSGEIDILDPAGYGAITISKSISIVNDGVGTAGVQQATAGQNAISINIASPTASDAVTLRGLNIDGLGLANNGVNFSSGGSLTVVNCVIQHFAGDGIYIAPTAGSMSFAISNTIASNNTINGISYFPAGGNANANGVIDRVMAANNGGVGVIVDSSVASGGTVTVTVSNSITDNNTLAGMYFSNTTGSGPAPTNITATIDSSYMNNNPGYGIFNAGSSVLLLSRSVVTSNGTGVEAENTFTNSYGDNRINWNKTDIFPGAPGLNETADRPR